VNQMFDKCNLLTKLLSMSALFALAAFADTHAAGTVSAIPGTLNYVEGSVSVNGQPVTNESVGKAAVGQDQVLSTTQGKAEMLLTPGVFLRLGDNSSVRMVSPNLTDTRVALLNGEAMVEVAQIFKENHLQVGINGTTTDLVKRGLYEFNADHPQVAVYDGEAKVLAGDREVKVKKGHEAELTGSVQVAKFNSKTQQDQLYAWSNLRSEYEAQASAQSAHAIYVGGGPWWYGPGWYWNPWWDTYGFLPGDGILYSPFGWPFFSPAFAYYAPVYYGGGVVLPGRHFDGGRAFIGRPGFTGRAPSAGAVRGFAAPRIAGGGFSAGAHAGGGFGGHMGGGFGGGHMGGSFGGGRR